MVDLTGLICRIFPSGRKTFCWRYLDQHRNKQQSRIEYGDFPDRSLEDVHRIHLSAKSARKNGQGIKDPHVLNRIIKEVVKDSANFVPLHKEYTLSDLVANRIKKHVEPVLGHFPADHVPPEEIEQLITHLRDSNQKEVVGQICYIAWISMPNSTLLINRPITIIGSPIISIKFLGTKWCKKLF